jgi:hypothetical protein
MIRLVLLLMVLHGLYFLCFDLRFPPCSCVFGRGVPGRLCNALRSGSPRGVLALDLGELGLVFGPSSVVVLIVIYTICIFYSMETFTAFGHGTAFGTAFGHETAFGHHAYYLWYGSVSLFHSFLFRLVSHDDPFFYSLDCRPFATSAIHTLWQVCHFGNDWMRPNSHT